MLHYEVTAFFLNFLLTTDVLKDPDFTAFQNFPSRCDGGMMMMLPTNISQRFLLISP